MAIISGSDSYCLYAASFYSAVGQKRKLLKPIFYYLLSTASAPLELTKLTVAFDSNPFPE